MGDIHGLTKVSKINKWYVYDNLSKGGIIWGKSFTTNLNIVVHFPANIVLYWSLKEKQSNHDQNKA